MRTVCATLLASVLSSTSNGQCAYAAMGLLATPFDSCCVYSMEETTSYPSYSAAYSYENETLTWNYFDDLECTQLNKSYEMDEAMQAIHHLNVQTEGEGDQCQTVDIKVSGSYSELLDMCDDTVATDDYFSRSYVVNECIAHSAEQISTKLLCDDEKISFLYFGDCTDCLCDGGIEQVYEYYVDKDCFEVTCNSDTRLSVHNTPQNMLKVNGQFVKNLLLRDQSPLMGGSKKKSESSEMNKQLEVKDVISPIASLSWTMSAVVGSIIFMIFCVLCRYMNGYQHKKEYEEL